MHRDAVPIKIQEVRGLFAGIEFPEYQREPDIWSREQKQRLIDSILRGFDIASIYLYKRDDSAFECIDGRQRLNAIMSFLAENESDIVDNGFPLRIQNEISSALTDEFALLDGMRYVELKASKAKNTLAQQAIDRIMEYPISVSILSESRESDEFNLQFLRLNLGTLINSGEKLNAMVGGMRDLIFESPDLGRHAFFNQVQIPTRRYAKEQVAAQVILQVFSKIASDEFARARYFDLQKFVKDNADIRSDDKRVQEVSKTLDVLNQGVGDANNIFRNRAIVISLVLLAWTRRLFEKSPERDEFSLFARAFVGRLRWQVNNMKNFAPDSRYGYLVEFQRHVTQASVEKPAVSRRHELLNTEFEYWLDAHMLTGDKEYANATGEPPPAS